MLNRHPRAFTLVELLVSTTLALLLMGAVVVIFGRVGEGITDSRSMLEAAERLRLAEVRLQMDLAGVTVTMNPPRKPENNEGYFEYIEGSVGVVAGAQPEAMNTEVTPNVADDTVGDFDDILMFTTRSAGRPFVGRWYNTATAQQETIQSDVAEVAWFLRGRTLHRRVLLVAPSAPLSTPIGESFYNANDISVRLVSGNPAANTLGDLTVRENRFVHPTDTFPFDVQRWGQLRLPTLQECSQSSWVVGQLPPVLPPDPATTDFWTNDSTQRISDDYLGSGERISDDVILTNVIGFDVKVFDPDRGEYVDIGNSGVGRFASSSTVAVGRDGNITMPSVYDTWPTHYESIGAAGLAGAPGRAANGLDDGDNGIVDDDLEKLTAPPYPYPLRGIQVKIRTFEPDSRQIREVTVVQDFLPQ